MHEEMRPTAEKWTSPQLTNRRPVARSTQGRSNVGRVDVADQFGFAHPAG